MSACDRKLPQLLLVKEILPQILISNSSVRLAVGGQLLGKHARQTISASPCGKQNIFYKFTPVLTYYHIWFTADKIVVVMNNQVGYTQQCKIIDFWRLNNDGSINEKRNSYSK